MAITMNLRSSMSRPDSCRSLLTLAAALGLCAAACGQRGKAKKGYAQEYVVAINDSGAIFPDTRYVGPQGEECVRFDAAGVRLTLPRGYEKVRPNTGVPTGLQVEGDFEITVAYDILDEPEAAGERGEQTRFTLDLGLDEPGLNAASISRGISGRGAEFVSWAALQPAGAVKHKTKMDYHAGAGKSGRLRLVRRGASSSPRRAHE